MATKTSVIKHSELNKLMTNEMRPWPTGTPASAKGEQLKFKTNGAPTTSADKKAGQIKKNSKLTPTDQNVGRYRSNANKREAIKGDTEGYS